MTKQLLRRHVQGSILVDNYGKFETVAALLEQQPRSLKLDTLFSTRNSGWTNTVDFHTACDLKGPTLVLIQCQNGVSYGGYTSISWSSNGQYQTDTKAFLFQIPNFARSKTKQGSQKFARTGRGNDIYTCSANGPVFGDGHDLVTFGNGSILTCNQSAYSTSGPLIPPSVPRDQHSCNMEVLLVSTWASGSAEELETPWQTGCSWTMQDSIALQKDIFKFNPVDEGLGVKTINILLCGGVGAGKSSIVSTVDSLCQGRISRRAPHGQGTGSLTRKLRKYKFTDPDTKEPVHWQLWDSMGWGANDYKKGELGFVLDGNLPNGCKLDDKISMKTAGFNKQPSVEDEVHCVCLVVPCDAATDDSYMERLREMRQFAREREMPTLVFLTKIDKYDPDVIGEDLSKTFHSARLLSLMEDLEESSGVGGCKDILPIKNLSKETEPTPEAGVLVCRALQQALYSAVDYLRECDHMETSEEDSELS